MDVRLVEINGGSMRNAIPARGRGQGRGARGEGRKFKQIVDAMLGRIAAEELAGTDHGFQWTVGAVQAPRCFSLDSSRRILDLLAAIPNGVLGMSRDIEGLVESSTNLGVVKTDGGTVSIVMLQPLVGDGHPRRPGAPARGHRGPGRGRDEQPEGYPGWQPNLASAVLAVTRARYKQAFGTDAELLAIHAGLECGLLTEKYPDLDIVSFGPNITGAHSPDEKVQISSVQKIWKLFTGTLEDLARA